MKLKLVKMIKFFFKILEFLGDRLEVCVSVVQVAISGRFHFFSFIYYYEIFTWYQLNIFHWTIYSLPKLTLDWLIFAKIFVIFVRFRGVLRSWSRF